MFDVSTDVGKLPSDINLAIEPEALEDKDSKVEKARQRMLYAASVQFPEPENVKSILEDLPVAKAMNSYSRVVNSRLELAPGESGTPQCRDRFIFRFWTISTNHINIINSIFLDNFLRCNSIVFGSRIPFRQTLEAYMNTQAHGFKRISVGEYGAKTTRLACLEKLDIVPKKLGVEKVPIFCDKTGEGNKPFIRSLDDEWLEVFKRMFDSAEESFDSSEGLFWQTYRLLGIASGRFFVTRWMTSKEYAMHQQKYVGAGPIYAAKTAALFKQEIEDFIIEGLNLVRRRRISSPGLGQDRGKKRIEGFDGQKQRINGIVEMHLLADLHLRTLPGEEGREKATIVSEFNIVHGFHPVHQIEIN
ncbi:hypothetical protein V8E51_016510 [Hyaloscypha variabilis]